VKISIFSLIFVLLQACTPGIHSIVKNRQCSVSINTPIQNFGNGVLVEVDKELYILTVAHLFDLNNLFELIYQKLQVEASSPEDALKFITMAKILMSTANKIDGSIAPADIYSAGMDITFSKAKLIAVDYDKDIALLRIDTSLLDKGQIEYLKTRVADFGYVEQLTPGREIYTITTPCIGCGVMVYFGKTGFETIVEDKDVLQTQFIIGHGVSGSPVFVEDSKKMGQKGKLVGLVSMEFSLGDPRVATRATYIITRQSIENFINIYKKLGKFCIGDKLNCDTMIVEKTLVLKEFVKFLQSKGINAN